MVSSHSLHSISVCWLHLNTLLKKHLQINKLKKHLKISHHYEIMKMITQHSAYTGLCHNNRWVGFNSSSEIYSVVVFEISDLFWQMKKNKCMQQVIHLILSEMSKISKIHAFYKCLFLSSHHTGSPDE